MDATELNSIIAKVDKEHALFSKKSVLNTLSATLPENIVGRTEQTVQLVRHLLGYKKKLVVPLISIYGRSGTGKSTLVRYVCKNIPEIQLCFVNLRKAKTVFGAANLILAELGEPNLKSAQGMNLAIKTIDKTIFELMRNTKKKLFVLALDEFDVLFYDKRGNPSDFVYKLVEMQSELGQKGCLCCIITISNNVLADYELDDRVRSRIGTSEIFFEPYSKRDVLSILNHRAQEAFDKSIDKDVLEYCAELSFLEHGDARRAVDLLRVAAELANIKNEQITKAHVDKASERIQQDRIEKVLTSTSYHNKIACLVLAMKTYGLEQDWHSTSSLYEKYKILLDKNTKPVSYRRFSELLKDLENTGLVNSNTSSKGRKGYSSEFKLAVSPETVGTIIAKEWWQKNVVEKKKASKILKKNPISKSDPWYQMYNLANEIEEKYW